MRAAGPKVALQESLLHSSFPVSLNDAVAHKNWSRQNALVNINVSKNEF